MNKKNSPSAGHNKKSFLNKPVEHIDITKFDARNIIDSMSKMSLPPEIQQTLQKFLMK